MSNWLLAITVVLNTLTISLMAIKKFQTQFDRDPSTMEGVTFSQSSLTHQEFKDEADINVLLARFEKTGSFYNPLNPPGGERRMPEFIDCTSVPEFLEAQKLVADANAQFATLPARVRDLCNNNPAALLAGLNDPVTRPVFLDALGVSQERGAGDVSPANANQPLAGVSAAVNHETAAVDGAPNASSAQLQK